MDKAWKQRIDEWIEEKATGAIDSYAQPGLFEQGINDVHVIPRDTADIPTVTLMLNIPGIHIHLLVVVHLDRMGIQHIHLSLFRYLAGLLVQLLNPTIPQGSIDMDLTKPPLK